MTLKKALEEAFTENDKIASVLFVIIISLLKVIKERKQILLRDFFGKTVASVKGILFSFILVYIVL